MTQRADGIVELLFDQDELRVLRWLFDDGLEAAGRMGSELAHRIGVLSPRVWNLRPGLVALFDTAEIGLLAQAFSLGQRANCDCLNRMRPHSADHFALWLVRRKMGSGPAYAVRH